MTKEELFCALDEYFDKKGKDIVKKQTLAAWTEIREHTADLMKFISALRSAEFVLQNIPLHLGKSHYQLRKDAILNAKHGGLFLEFGVAKGFWINQFAKMRDVTFHGFDSFEGLPSDWSVYGKGHYNLGGVLPPVEDNVILHKGWFNESLPLFLEENKEKVSFIHMDCDLYDSTMTVLDLLRDRLLVGTQIVLDDFMLQPGWEKEEHKAFFDFVEKESIEYKYTGYSNAQHGCSASVEITAIK